jgi:hypothetical protein
MRGRADHSRAARHPCGRSLRAWRRNGRHPVRLAAQIDAGIPGEHVRFGESGLVTSRRKGWPLTKLT